MPENEISTGRKVKGSWATSSPKYQLPFSRMEREKKRDPSEDWWRASLSVVQTGNEKQTSLPLSLWWEERWKEGRRQNQGLEKKSELEQFNPDKIL